MIPASHDSLGPDNRDALSMAPRSSYPTRGFLPPARSPSWALAMGLMRAKPLPDA